MKTSGLSWRLHAALTLALASCLASVTPLAAGAGPLADFGAERASASARHVAHWALHSGDNGGRAVVVVDKQDARVFVFASSGRLLGAAPVLLGLARGDHTVPGIGERPLSQIRPHERTTPAGRFIAEPGFNAKGEDIVWVDYEAAVSMHRVRPHVKSERRLQRLASATPADNRISYGCINLPTRFYDEVFAPAALAGAVIYVLPETRPPAEVFDSWDVPARRMSPGADPAGTV